MKSLANLFMISSFCEIAVSDNYTVNGGMVMSAPKTREKVIVRTGIIGIVANVILAGFKSAVGFLSGSIAIVLDAVNNMSDALSSIITVIGTKLAGRPADKAHPFGHGRYENIAATVISVIILYAGITSLIESIKNIIHPETPTYSYITFIVVGVAVLVKIVLGLYVRKTGKKWNSDALVNSGTDALQDAVISASTIAAAAIFLIWGVSLEAYLGVIIAGFIIKAGIEMIRDTISKLLGERADGELSAAVKETICQTEGVLGAYDLVMTSYGPDRWMASVHISVPDEWTANKIDTVSREIMHRVAVTNHVIITAVGIYSHNTSDDEVIEMREKISELIAGEQYVLQIHGFFCDTAAKTVRFDLVIDFDVPDQNELIDGIQKKIEALYPDYTICIQPDSDFSD